MTSDIDLSNCDREPIQYVGAIQPHGALLVLSEPDLRILWVSGNSQSCLGAPPAQLLGQPLTALLDEQTVAALAAELTGPELSSVLLRLRTVRPLNSPDRFHLFANRASGRLLLEFERSRADARSMAPDLYPQVHSALQRLQAAPSLSAFFDLAVTEIRALTGFDRVMAYRFAADGSGEVIAESVAHGREAYLGLHYPAVDIPEPARRLFSLSWVRHLPDVDYDPVALIPATESDKDAPIDLSYVFSRSVSTMYTEYLKNMGVRATLVTTLLKDGRLWGLISCMHHDAPRYLPYETRVAVECLAHTISLLMAAKETEEHYAYQLRLAATREQLLDALIKTEDFHQALVGAEPHLLSALDAGGAALYSDGRLSRLGNAPAEEQILALIEWLAGREALTFVSHELAADYPPAADFAGVASGLLAVRIARNAPDAVLWFRPEWRQTVNWAGNPNKPVEVSETDGQSRLHPRASFALWRELVAGCSRHWLDCEIAHAAELRRDIVDLLVSHTERLRRMNSELVASNEELDTFAYAASHDLKEPLRSIHYTVQFLEEDEGASLSDAGRERLSTILRLTRRMDDLIESLLHFSRAGRLDLQLRRVVIQDVVEQALEGLAPLLHFSGARVRVVSGLPEIDCDPVRAVEIFSNLISNAAKYNDKADKQIEVGCQPESDPLVFFVRDNGIGIEARQQTRVFQIFRRLHGREEFGGGVGAGLTLVKKAVERHGGRIWLESTPGESTTFFFTLAPSI